MEDDFPGVDIDVGVHPAVALVEEEHEVILVLAVEIFLVGHGAVVLAFDEEGVVDKGDVDDTFALAVVDAHAGVVALDEAAYGVLREAGGYGGDGAATFGGCRAGGFVAGVVGDRFVGDEGIVPVHRAVVGGYREGEVILVDGLTREVLEHDVDVVGVLDEGDGVDICPFVVGEELRCERAVVVADCAVVEAVDVVAYICRAGGFVTVAAEGAGEVGVVCGVGGDCEVGADALAAPSDELVVARCDVDVHEVAFGAECVAALALLPYDVARCGVDEVERDGVDLLREGVGVEHVVVKDESGFVVRVAVAFVVIDHLVAGAEG